MDKNEIVARAIDVASGQLAPGKEEAFRRAREADPETERLAASVERIWRRLGDIPTTVRRPELSDDLALELSARRFADACLHGENGMSDTGIVANERKTTMTAENWDTYLDESMKKTAAMRLRIREIGEEARERERQFELLAERAGTTLERLRSLAQPDFGELDEKSSRLLDDFQNRLEQTRNEIMSAAPVGGMDFPVGLKA